MVGHDPQDRFAPRQLGGRAIEIGGEVLALGLQPQRVDDPAIGAVADDRLNGGEHRQHGPHRDRHQVAAQHEGEGGRHDDRQHEREERRQVGGVEQHGARGHAAEHEHDEHLVGDVRRGDDRKCQQAPDASGERRADDGPRRRVGGRPAVTRLQVPDEQPKRSQNEKQREPGQQRRVREARPQHSDDQRRVDDVGEDQDRMLVEQADLLDENLGRHVLGTTW